MNARSRKPHENRRGAVAVEFAVVLPFLMATFLGLVEMSRVYDSQNLLEMGVREGARLAAMDREGLLQGGQSANDKVIQDVANFLASAGVGADDIQVAVHAPGDPSQEFDLDDPQNDLELFEVTVSVPYSAVSYTPVSEVHDYTLTASIIFRNGRAVISE